MTPAAPPAADRFGMEVLPLHECLELLRNSDVGRICVVIGDHPEVFPVNFIVDHGTVLFRTAEGTKLAAVVFGANVAFEADGYDRAKGEAWSVVVKGRASEVRDLHERFDAADLPLFPWHAAPKPRFVRVTPVEVTGRRFHVAGHGATEQPRRSAPE